MADQPSLPTGDEPSLGGDKLPQLTEQEPALGGASALFHLVDALTSPDGEIRQKALEAFSRFDGPVIVYGGPVSIDHIIDTLWHNLNDQEAGIRWRTARALGHLGSKIFDPKIKIRMASILTICLNDSDPLIYESALAAMGRLDTSGVPFLLGATLHPNRQVSQFALSVLKQVGDPAVPPLIGSLQHAEWKIRRYAAELLGDMEIPPADLERRAKLLSALLSVLDDPVGMVRWFAIKGIRHHLDCLGDPPPEITAPLMGHIRETIRHDPGDRTRLAAMRILIKYGEAEVSYLLEVMESCIIDEYYALDNVGFITCLWLAELGCIEVIPHLVKYLGKGCSLEEPGEAKDNEVAFCLRYIGTPTALAAIKVWQDQSSS